MLQPNMTIHFMPALWFEDWGLEITESIRITETGAETLANWPRIAGEVAGEVVSRGPSARQESDYASGESSPGCLP